ncbi:hypothetical protein HYC85_015407 [Camellia sinensis]|uniref:Uncharacterized protein n=1 Tax=Camellia sinensis TaxID=4442 RepID=A0A7J7GWU0_CAMSI|nr:hypothetical protein HYC85_015407 [Camellia sinensis]
MSKAAVDVPLKGGFSFDLCRRNEMLSKKGVQALKFLKTGTTIVEMNGETLGWLQITVMMESSLERIQEPLKGPLLLIRIVRKIHFMAPNIYCCGAGTAANTEAVTGISKSNFSIRISTLVSSQLQLQVPYWSESRVVTALTLLKSHITMQGYVQAALVLGGVDVTGPHLHTTVHLPTWIKRHTTVCYNGFWFPCSNGFFESKYHEGITWDGGKNLVCEAICSGIFHDLGSGSKVDVCVITKGHTEYLRNHQLPNPSMYGNAKGCSFPKKTEVLLTKITAQRQMVSVTKGGDEMEE